MDLILDTLKFSGNSAAGPDGVPFCAWRAVPELSAKLLFDCFAHVGAGKPVDTAWFNQNFGWFLPKTPDESFVLDGISHDAYLPSSTRPLSGSHTFVRHGRVLALTVVSKIQGRAIGLILRSALFFSGCPLVSFYGPHFFFGWRIGLILRCALFFSGRAIGLILRSALFFSGGPLVSFYGPHFFFGWRIGLILRCALFFSGGAFSLARS